MRRLPAAAPWLVAAHITSGQVSPFEDVEWRDGQPPRVMLDGRWWEPVSIGGVPYETLLARARERYADEAMVRKRLDEDLPEVLGLCGVTVKGNRLGLRLRPAEGGEVVTIESAEMTEANRQRLWAKRVAASAFDPAGLLQWAETVISERHSYSAARGVDVGAEFGRLRASLEARASPAECIRALRRVIALSGDRHAQVAGRWAEEADEAESELGAMSVALAPLDLGEGTRVVAVRDGGQGLVDPEHPFVVAIDGVGIERWLDLAAECVAGRVGAAAARGRV
ncbi:MAG TPA: hypothetical protein VFF69_02555 [Phycisphaerales bacterium]|nr:hypothetical protein [Phycisphaerales bacterium]